MGEHARDVCLHPLRKRLHMLSQFAAEWRQAVLHLWRFGREDDPQHEAIGFKGVKRVREHAFAYAADAAHKLAEAMRLLQKQHQDEGTPSVCNVIEDLSGRAVFCIKIAFLLACNPWRARWLVCH